MRTQIEHNESKGFRARIEWTDVCGVNSHYFPDRGQAEAWLAQTLATQRNCVFSEKRAVAERARKMAAAALAIALLLPSLPALAEEPLKDPGSRGSGRVAQQFTPPDNGWPIHSGYTGTR